MDRPDLDRAMELRVNMKLDPTNPKTIRAYEDLILELNRSIQMFDFILHLKTKEMERLRLQLQDYCITRDLLKDLKEKK